MAVTTRFRKLFEPGSIGAMRVRNRIVMSPMGTNYAADDGSVTDLMVDHYEQRARGGVGLVTVEGTCVEYPRGKGWINEAGADDDKYISGLKRIVTAVHQHGAKVALQLHHAGREARQSFTGLQPIGPSPVPAPGGDVPREMSRGEVEEIVQRFAEAAARAKKAGFDGIEIHGAHGYLLAEFLSPVANKRQDEYGGVLANRARFLCNVVKAIKNAVGDAYPVWCRLNGRESGAEGALPATDAQQVAKMAQEVGCDALHISTYGYGAEATATLPEVAGDLAPLAEGVKRAVSVPVIAVGAMNPEVGERILETGKADFIAMGRELLCDPELPNKAMQGRVEDIVPCIHCLNCVDRLQIKSKKVTCAVNAALGRYSGPRMHPAASPKKVLVVGSGPGGLETARVAALRGHKVTLYEREAKLGGQIQLASIPPHKERIKDYADYLIAQMHKLGVMVETSKDVTPELVESLKPDAVVMATGAVPNMPPIPGLDKMRPIFAQACLCGEAGVGEKVAIIGGGIVGCETAEFLAEKGKKATIIEILPRVAADMAFLRRATLLYRLREKGVTILTGATCETVSEAGIVVATKDGRRQTIVADTILVAAGGTPRKDMYQALLGRVPEVHIVGDAVEPRTILEAVSDGFDVGLAL